MCITICSLFNFKFEIDDISSLTYSVFVAFSSIHKLSPHRVNKDSHLIMELRILFSLTVWSWFLHFLYKVALHPFGWIFSLGKFRSCWRNNAHQQFIREDQVLPEEAISCVTKQGHVEAARSHMTRQGHGERGKVTQDEGKVTQDEGKVTKDEGKVTQDEARSRGLRRGHAGWDKVTHNEARWCMMRQGRAGWTKVRQVEERSRRMKQSHAERGQVTQDEARSHRTMLGHAERGQVTQDEARSRRTKPIPNQAQYIYAVKAL